MVEGLGLARTVQGVGKSHEGGGQEGGGDGVNEYRAGAEGEPPRAPGSESGSLIVPAARPWVGTLLFVHLCPACSVLPVVEGSDPAAAGWFVAMSELCCAEAKVGEDEEEEEKINDSFITRQRRAPLPHT